LLRLVFRYEVKDDARIAPRKPIDDGGNEARGEMESAPDPHFSGLWVREKLDVLDALAQGIENSRSAVEQRATIPGRFNALAVAIEQANAERLLQFRDRSRNCGLRGIEPFGRLQHAARLYDRHEDIQVVQFHPASDAIGHLHASPIAVSI
jgi:hypothetical protein